MKLRPFNRSARSRNRIDVDLFAGGGGAGEGKRKATGRSADVAINHWDRALAMYRANHPTARLLIEDIRNVEPLEATLGKLVRFLWASPTCVHFSRASGKRLSPDAVKIRALAETLLPWLDLTHPEVMFVENVVEFLGWGPVYEHHNEGCPGEHDETGDSCADWCKYGRPIPELKGTLFDAWRAEIEARGYSFDYRVLKAWEFGAPTTRERVYIVCVRDGRPYVWPTPTHCRPEDVARTGLLPWRTAASIIDWSIPCKSIFDRAVPHVAATRRRLAKGMRKFVLETASPFLMHLTHGDRHAPHSIDDPVPTVTAANRGEQALAVPYMIHRSNGERPGQDARVYNVQDPCKTVVAGGIKMAPVVAKLAFLSKAYSERPTGGWNGGSDLRNPIGTATAQDHHHLVTIHATSLLRYNGERRPADASGGDGARGSDLRDPVSTLDASNRIGLMAASLLRYNGESIGQHPDAPIGTIDATDRYAHVEYACSAEWNEVTEAKAHRVYDFLMEEGVDGPWMDHEHKLVRLPACPDLVIYDIGMRMLVARELFRANGFSDEYVIDLADASGKPLTKTEQVRLAGNSVCPDVAEALIRAALAQLPGRPRSRARKRGAGRQVEMFDARDQQPDCGCDHCVVAHMVGAVPRPHSRMGEIRRAA